MGNNGGLMAEKLSAAQQKAIAFMRGKSVKELGALGTSIGALLAELISELADSKQEAVHFKNAFETVRDEIKVLVSVCIRKLGGDRLTITKQEYLDTVKGNVELYTSHPDGMRLYELRERRKPNPVDAAVHGAVNGSVRPS